MTLQTISPGQPGVLPPEAPTPAHSQVGGLGHLLLLKRRVLRHGARAYVRQGWIAPASAVGMGFFFAGGGVWLFLSGLRFLNSFPTVGPLIVDRILVLFFVTLLVMLTFSSTLVSFSTLYKSEESSYLWTLPLGPLEVFRARIVEAIGLASWAFVVLGGPMLICWGLVREASWLFYTVLPMVIVPFALLCGLLGSFLTVLLAYLFPRLSWKALGVIVAAGAVGAGFYVLRAFAPWNVEGDRASHALNRLLSGLQGLQSPLSPAGWAFSALSESADGRLGAGLYYVALLGVNTLALDLLLRWVVPPLLFPGYSALNRESRVKRRDLDRGPLAWLGRRLRWMDPIDQALLIKDFRLFWRDPSQWSQFLLFTVLMLVYVGNIRHMPQGIKAPEWINILHFLNLMACALLLATLTSRFIYPLVSLEGKPFWVVGLAPIPRWRLLRQKLILSFGTTLLFGEVMTVASSLLLGVPGPRVILFALVILVMNLTLSSLAVGISALYPDFKEDNPSKIVNGVGGLINFFGSIGYTLLGVLLIAAPYHLHQTDRLGDERFGLVLPLCLGVAFLGSVACAVLPLAAGIRKFARFEF